MSNKIEAVLSIKKLNVVCVIGAEPHERLIDQTVEIDIDISLGDCKECITDSLQDAYDYTIIAQLATEVAHNGKFKLIEALAYAIGTNLMEKFSPNWTKVKVYKPRPVPHLDGCSAEITFRK